MELPHLRTTATSKGKEDRDERFETKAFGDDVNSFVMGAVGALPPLADVFRHYLRTELSIIYTVDGLILIEREGAAKGRKLH